MSAREELIAAAESLRDQGHARFSPVQLIDEARRLGCNYENITLRTMITQHMRVDRGKVKGGIGFLPAGSGQYRLAANGESDLIEESYVLGSNESPTISEDDKATIGGHEWFWEGNVQAALVRHLANDGWRIRRVADTHSREHGIDIEADRQNESLLVEVKGYPSATYRGGPNEGQKKNFGVGAQARTYFGNALLAGLLMRADNPTARVVLAFPDISTFNALSLRTGGPLQQVRIEVWLVDEQGRVFENVGVDVVTSKFSWAPGDVVVDKHGTPGRSESETTDDSE